MNEPQHAKVALVTGSGKHRVGNVVARALAERGFSIALHYNRSADEAQATVDELRASGTETEAFQANVADEDQVGRMFAQLRERFGRLDAAITAAAIWQPKPLDAVTAADVRRHFEINALGTFLCCQHAGRIMADQPEGGAIVTIGDWAVERPYRNYAAYFPSKGAIPAMTRSLAVELAHRNPNIRVNAILPGPVMLPEDLSEHERREVVAGTLVKRLGTPEHVAATVLFLVENDFVTGVCIPVDGGRTIAGAG